MTFKRSIPVFCIILFIYSVSCVKPSVSTVNYRTISEATSIRVKAVLENKSDKSIGNCLVRISGYYKGEPIQRACVIKDDGTYTKILFPLCGKFTVSVSASDYLPASIKIHVREKQEISIDAQLSVDPHPLKDRNLY